MGYEPEEKEIALRAWCMYEVNPARHGHDQTHWFEARRQLIREHEMGGKEAYEEVSGAITNVLQGRPGPADWEVLRNAEIAAHEKANEARRAMLEFKEEKRWADYYAARDAGKEVPTDQPLSVGEKVLERLGRFLRHLTG